MSTTIDSKVVEMKFDNSKFESNVKETMSTLDKLKASLAKISGKHATLDVDTSSTNKGILSLGNAVDTVGSKFSALDQIIVGSLRRIGEQALDAGEKLIKSLSTDNIMAGWSKYDEKTSSVQTLVNSTGKSVEEINEYLDQLMWYSDETSYSFTEMTSALAQMTSTGGDIDKLIPTITGIANATAYAGKTGEAFNHTIRNITQSYNAGYLQLMDWKSLNLAGTSSKQLTEQLIKAAEELGTVQKGFLTIENFAEHLKDKNITSDVMDLAFSRFSAMSQEAYKLVQSGEFETASQAIEAIADDFDTLSRRAFQSAQEAKTFMEAIDATKDAVSSGWMETFEIIFGNYEQAKELWTDIANRMWEFFAGGAEGRNELLSEVMSNGWDALTGKINDCGIATDTFEGELEKIITRHGLNVDSIKEKYGDLQSWFEKSDGKYNKYITETLNNMAFATEKWSNVRKLSNEDLKEFDKIVKDIQTKKIKDVNEAEEKLFATLGEYTRAINKKELAAFFESGGKSVVSFTKSMEMAKKEMIQMSKAEKYVFDYGDEEQFKAFQTLAIDARDANSEVSQLVDTLNRPTGREMLLNSLFNVLDSFEAIVATIKGAFIEIFPPASALTIQNIIEKIEKLTERMKDFFTSEKNADKLKRTFKGLFAVLDIIKIVFTDIGKILLSVIRPLFGKTNDSVLDLTASLGDNLVKIRDWIKANDKIGVITAWLSNKVEKAVTVFKSWTQEGGLLNNVFKVMSKHLTEIKDAFGKWLDGLIESEDKPKYIIDSLISAFEDGIPRFIEAAGKAIDELIGAIKKSTDEGKFNEAGESALQSFIDGFKNEDGLIFETFKEIGQKLLDRVKELPWEKIFAVGLSLSMIGALKHVNRYMDKILDTIAPLQGILKNASGILKSVSTTITSIGKAVNKEATGDMALKFAEAVAILIGAVTVLAVLPEDDYKQAEKAAVLIGAMVMTLAVAMKIMTTSLSTMQDKNPAFYISMMLGYMGVIAAISLYIGAITLLIKSLEGVSIIKGLTFIAATFGSLAAILFVITKLAKETKHAKSSLILLSDVIRSIGAFMIEAAIAMKIVGSLDDDAFVKGTTFIVAMGVFVAALMLVANITKNMPNKMAKFGKAMQSIGVAMIFTALAMKIIGTMDEEDLKKGMKFFTRLGLFIALMMIVADNRNLSESIGKFGKMMSSIGLAMILAAVSLKIIGGMSGDELAKGMIFMNSFFGFVIVMTLITNEGKKSIDGFAKLMRSLGISLILMAVAVKILGGMDVGSIFKGEAAVAGLMTMLWLLIKSMKGMEKEAPKIAVTLIAASLCIAILAGIVFLVGQLSPETLKKGVATVGALSLMVAALIAVTRLAKSTPDMPKVLLQITLMIAMLVASIAILVLISDDVSQILGTAEALALVIAAVGGMMVATSKIKVEPGMWKTMAMMGAVIAELALIIGLLSKFGGNAKAMISSATAISILMVSLVGSMKLIEGTSISNKSVATMALMGLVVAELALVLGVMSKFNVHASIEDAISLGILVNALAIALIPLSMVGETGPMIYNGILAFETLIAATTGVLAGIGYLFEKLDSDASTIDMAVKVLTKVGEALGGFFGGFLAGFGNELLTLLPSAGQALSDFYTNATPFLDGMASLPPGVAEGAESLADAILKLTAGEALQLLLNLFSGGSALDAELLKNSFKAIGEGIGAFIKSVDGFSDADITAVKNAAEAASYLTDLINKLPAEGGFKQTIMGSVDFEEFINNLKKFGPALQEFSTQARYMDTGAIKRAAEAAQGLSEFANSLPEYTDGSLKGWLLGDKINIEEFGEQLSALAKGLVKFYKEISGDNAINVKVIKSATSAAEGLAGLANALPSTNGKFSEWFGGGATTLDTFGEQLTALGIGLKDFSIAAAGIIISSVKNAVGVVSDIADIAIKLTQNEENFSIFKSSAMSDLSEDLPKLGEALMSFNDSVKSLSGGGASNVSFAIDNLHKVVDTVVAMQGIDYEYIYSFKDALNQLAEFDMEGLVNTFSVSGIEQVGEAGRKLTKSIQEGLAKGGPDIIKTAGMLMTSILNELHLHYHYFHDTGYEITNQLRSGVRMGEAGLVYETKGIVSSAQRSINDYYPHFVAVGAHLMNGLHDGLASQEDAVVGKAQEIAAKVLEVMNQTAEIKSPSKATFRMGRYLDEGLINGMKKYSRQVYSTAETLSTKTLDGFSKSIDQIYEVIDADLNPVITPTINLDYVKQGVSDINSMFNAKSLNANAELQNGVDMNGAGGPTISFTQINNSPKALSRIDIYRQTRNQIAQMKGALN